MNGAARKLKTWTQDDVVRMVAAGILHEDDPLELIEGELVEASPQGPPHASTSGLLYQLLHEAYGAQASIRGALPLDCGADSLPEPDLAVVQGRATDYRTRHPRGDEAALVVEIAWSSHAVDHEKAHVYAAASVPEYWIVDLLNRRLEVHKKPTPQGYSVVTLLSETEEITPPGLDVVWPIRDLIS